MNIHTLTNLKKLPAFLGSLLLVCLLAACSVSSPPPLDQQDMARLAAVDQQTMFGNQEPVTGAITLEEAEARAIKYNLQHRLALMQRALAENLTDVKYFSLMPDLVAEAGYQTRNNDSASSSVSIDSGEESLEPSKSSERNSRTAGLKMTWNILDFGLSYYEAKAYGNKALAAEERRRRVVNDIIRKTKAAYWKAVSAEKMRNEVAAVLAQASTALEQSRETERRRLLPPLVTLRYQRDLLGMVRQLEQLDIELAKAKEQLSALMNLAPGREYSLAMPEDPGKVPEMSFKLDDLESLAMIQRPELREESYLARNAVLETRMAMLRMFPNASLFGGLNYNSNKYLVNSSWADAGVQVGWNLFKLLSIPAELKAGESREKVASLRRQALRMTVLSQVHIAWHQRHLAQKNFLRSQELCDLQKAIRQQTVNAASGKAATQLELIRTKVETLLAIRARDLGYAEMIAAQDAVYQAAGLDSMPAKVRDLSVAGLASAIGEKNRLNELGQIYVPKLNFAYAVESQPSPATAPAAPEATQAVESTTMAQQDATRHPAIRLVTGQPWQNLGSLQGSQP